ncbi:MAG: hypothetical protein ACRED6_01365 [Stellaceae bacterium]
MKLPRDVSGRALANALMQRWGYRQGNRVGTLNAILRVVVEAKGVSREEIVASL